MIQKYRKQFNEEFSQEKYQKLIETLEKSSGTTNGFRQSESPIFLSKDFKNKLTDACDSIISQVKTFSNEELQKAIPVLEEVLKNEYGMAINDLFDKTGRWDELKVPEELRTDEWWKKRGL
mgnify:CR=1 FL=1